MLTQVTIITSLVLSATCLSVEKTKAASPYTNCGCQCSSLTFRDSSDTVQGNCATVDATGAQWCYTDDSSCQDLVQSQRFPHNPWSYEACATPALGSYLCPSTQTIVTVEDHIHPQPVVPSHAHAPLVVAAAPSHTHVYPLQHITDIPQGFNAPIPKSAALEAPQK